MADRTDYPIKSPKSDMKLLTAVLQGAGAADMVNTESANMGGGEIVSAVRTGTGLFTLTLRKPYPQLKALCDPAILGTTAGLEVRFLTFDPVAKTATIVTEVGAVATDPAATDFLHFAWFVRNSGLNK